MKKIILLAVIVSLASGCVSHKRRTSNTTTSTITATAQQAPLTINATVGADASGAQKVSISTIAPGHTGPYNINLSLAPNSNKALTSPLPPAPPAKNVWYSTTTPEAKKVATEVKTIKIPPKTNSSHARVDPNTDQVIWVN